MRRLILLVVLLAGCGTPGYIKAEAVEGTLNRVMDRHDDYVAEDESLSELERRTNNRDTELLRKLLEEAK